LQLEGMRQTYLLGQTLRRRYANFVSETYNTNEIYFRSSDVNRTLTSAYCVGTGFYENKDHRDIKWPIGWQPIPVHTVPKNMDRMLSEDIESCPRISDLDSELENSPFFRSIYEQNKEFFQYLTTVTGFANLRLVNISWVFDNLRSELGTRPHAWPQWVNTSVYEKAQALTRLYVLRKFGALERIRLSAGMLLKDIADRLQVQTSVIGDNESRLKMFCYSGHDANILLFLSALDFYKTSTSLPDFASCVLIELWQSEQLGRHIKLFYRSSATEEFVELQIPNCGRPCRLEKFDSLLRRYVPDDLEGECGAKKHHREEEILKFLIASFSLTIFVLLAIIIILTTLLFQRRQAKYVRYRPVETSVLNRLLDENTSESELSSLEVVDVNR